MKDRSRDYFFGICTGLLVMVAPMIGNGDFGFFSVYDLFGIFQVTGVLSNILLSFFVYIAVVIILYSLYRFIFRIDKHGSFLSGLLWCVLGFVSASLLYLVFGYILLMNMGVELI